MLAFGADRGVAQKLHYGGAVRPLLLLSLLCMTFVLAAKAARRPHPPTLSTLLRATATVVLLYVVALIVIFPRLP